MFALTLAHLTVWAADCMLANKPPMPERLTRGQCDNWRPLIAVADACGPQIGELAREIAVRMCQNLDEDFEVLLLRDIRDLFDPRHGLQTHGHARTCARASDAALCRRI
jgi:hypothetical protein